MSHRHVTNWSTVLPPRRPHAADRSASPSRKLLMTDRAQASASGSAAGGATPRARQRASGPPSATSSRLPGSARSNSACSSSVMSMFCDFPLPMHSSCNRQLQQLVVFRGQPDRNCRHDVTVALIADYLTNTLAAYHRLSPPVDFGTVEPFNEPRAAFSWGDCTATPARKARASYRRPRRWWSRRSPAARPTTQS